MSWFFFENLILYARLCAQNWSIFSGRISKRLRYRLLNVGLTILGQILFGKKKVAFKFFRSKSLSLNQDLQKSRFQIRSDVRFYAFSEDLATSLALSLQCLCLNLLDALLAEGQFRMRKSEKPWIIAKLSCWAEYKALKLPRLRLFSILCFM